MYSRLGHLYATVVIYCLHFHTLYNVYSFDLQNLKRTARLHTPDHWLLIQRPGRCLPCEGIPWPLSTVMFVIHICVETLQQNISLINRKFTPWFHLSNSGPPSIILNVLPTPPNNANSTVNNATFLFVRAAFPPVNILVTNSRKFLQILKVKRKF